MIASVPRKQKVHFVINQFLFQYTVERASGQCSNPEQDEQFTNCRKEEQRGRAMSTSPPNVHSSLSSL